MKVPKKKLTESMIKHMDRQQTFEFCYPFAIYIFTVIASVF